MLRDVLARLFAIGPLLFGIGFMAPVIAALINATGLVLPFGLAPIYVGLAIGVVWGAIATKRGAWI